MSTLKMPSSYELVDANELMEYSGEGPGTIIGLYKVLTYVVVNWQWITSIASSSATLISMINSWKQRNGTYYLKGNYVPGGNNNLYPPHSAQGATGYWTYYSEWVSN